MPRDSPALPASVAPSSLAWTTAAPAVFVLLWSTGFIAAKAGLPYVQPMTFLAIRFVLVVALMLPLALLVRAPWPELPMAGHIAVVGLLMHACYLGGVFASIYHGLPAGLSALIVGLQPVLTATVVGPLLGERVSARQWLGLVAGFAGVAVVLFERYGFGSGGFGIGAVLLSVLALVGISAGTLYQKRYCAQANLYTGAVIQYAAAFVPLTLIALALETMEVVWAPPLIVAILWLAFVLSVGTVSLLYLLIRRGAVSKVASLFFLVPPTTALVAWLMFDERLGLLALGGIALTAVGVWLVQKG